MLKILGRIPRTEFHVACSGGSDSMILVDFLRRFPKNKFDIIHFNHGTECCGEAEEFVTSFCRGAGIECHVGRISGSRGKNESQEEFWRNKRYEFFSKYSDKPILLSHHLNDAIETWIMTCACGNPQLIPYCNPKYNIIRPLLATSKADIEKWAKNHGVKYVVDRSNFDTDIRRNYVRHEMMKHFYAINPGIETSIRKRVMAEYNRLTRKDPAKA